MTSDISKVTRQVQRLVNKLQNQRSNNAAQTNEDKSRLFQGIFKTLAKTLDSLEAIKSDTKFGPQVFSPQTLKTPISEADYDVFRAGIRTAIDALESSLAVLKRKSWETSRSH